MYLEIFLVPLYIKIMKLLVKYIMALDIIYYFPSMTASASYFEKWSKVTANLQEMKKHHIPSLFRYLIHTKLVRKCLCWKCPKIVLILKHFISFWTEDPIYVFNQTSEQTARMTELYRAVNSVEGVCSTFIIIIALITQ